MHCNKDVRMTNYELSIIFTTVPVDQFSVTIWYTSAATLQPNVCSCYPDESQLTG